MTIGPCLKWGEIFLKPCWLIKGLTENVSLTMWVLYALQAGVSNYLGWRATYVVLGSCWSGGAIGPVGCLWEPQEVTLCHSALLQLGPGWPGPHGVQTPLWPFSSPPPTPLHPRWQHLIMVGGQVGWLLNALHCTPSHEGLAAGSHGVRTVQPQCQQEAVWEKDECGVGGSGGTYVLCCAAQPSPAQAAQGTVLPPQASSVGLQARYRPYFAHPCFKAVTQLFSRISVIFS